MNRMPSDAEWTAGRVATLPKRWADALLARWAGEHPKEPYKANVELRTTTEALLQVRIPLDASDASICDAAALLADRCSRRTEIFHLAKDARAAMERLCSGQGISPPPAKNQDGPAIARMCCPMWWRGKLRKHQGRTVEAAAIRLGRVSKAGDLYVTNECLRARLQQNARNAATLETTIARNQDGQEFTLAELAARGPSNKTIRRCELMTRIAGFERIARDLGHGALLITVTCPSRFHKFRTVNGGKKVLPNPNYDPTEDPVTAQQYLTHSWALMRAELARRKIGLYGFRVVEPQHDGTPHWHLLLFCEERDVCELTRIVTEHALRDSPNEKGAQEHRCDTKRIDWSKGSAAGYVAKYIAKNIDGHGVGNDLHGGSAVENAFRVEAWAAVWGIRQFQQIGGPPVGAWRELRRVRSLPAGSPEHLRQAHDAVNRVNVVQGKPAPSVAWDAYCNAQGGVFCGRAARIKVSMQQPETLGRYGDPSTPRPIGVETTSREIVSPAWNPTTQYERLVHWIVPSSRREWQIIGRPGSLLMERSEFAERAQHAQPRTRVNNCTDKASWSRQSYETAAECPAHLPCNPVEGLREVHPEALGTVSSGQIGLTSLFKEL